MFKTITLIMFCGIIISCGNKSTESKIILNKDKINNSLEYANEKFHINEKENIFEYLFTDIAEDFNEYNDKIEYKILQINSNEFLRPETEIHIMHKDFTIIYYPSYYEWEKYGNGNKEIYIRQLVEINKKTDEIILGKYIGENIEALIDSYQNEIKGISEFEKFTYYSYGYNKNSTSDYRRIFIGIDVVNNIIVKISYGYEI